jgi:hypothetical protein
MQFSVNVRFWGARRSTGPSQMQANHPASFFIFEFLRSVGRQLTLSPMSRSTILMKTRRRVIQGVCAVAAVGSGAAAEDSRVAEFRNGNSWFRLHVLAYQFPEATDLDDANWLIINGECSLKGRQWSFIDPCLETWDLERLATWLSAAALTRCVSKFIQDGEPK